MNPKNQLPSLWPPPRVRLTLDRSMKAHHHLIACISLLCGQAVPGAFAEAQAPAAMVAPQGADVGETLPASLTLGRALELTLVHNPDIAAARERIREQDGVVLEARSALLPRLDATGDYNAKDENRIESFGGYFAPQDQSWTTDLGLSYVIYSGGKNSANVKAAQSYRVSAELRLKAVINDILLSAAERYFDAMLARGNIDVQKQAISVLGEQLENAKNRFNAGVGHQFDVLQAEVALANARPPLVRAEGQYKLAVDQLRRITGLPYPEGADAADIKIAESWPSSVMRENLQGAIGKALLNRPELSAIQEDIRAGQQRVEAARAGKRPSVQLNTSYGAQSLSFSNTLSDGLAGWTAGLRVSIPVFDGGLTRGRVQQAAAQLRQTELSADKQKLDIEGEVRQAWYSWEEATKILETSQLVVKQAEEALRLARTSFDAGTKTQLDVLQSQLDLTRARLEELQARYTYHTALARLRRAIGTSSSGLKISEKNP